MIVPESALPKVAPGEAIATVCDGLRLDAIVETAELAGATPGAPRRPPGAG